MAKTLGNEDSGFDTLAGFKPVAGAKFYALRLPEGKQQFGYRIKLTKDMEIVPNVRFPNPDGSPKPEYIATVEFVKVWYDDEVTVGEVKRINFSRHTSGETFWANKGSGKAGQVFDVMIQFKAKPSKAGGNAYYPYAIIPVIGEHSAEDFVRASAVISHVMDAEEKSRKIEEDPQE